MTDSKALLSDLQARVKALQDDLRERASVVPDFDRVLRDEYAAAARVRRTAETFETWREEAITQAAVAWVLATVFVRFLEDNGLIEPRLSGPAGRRAFAIDHHAAYFQSRPLETDREYLLHVFGEMGGLPATRELFDPAHNPLWRLTPSGDAAKALLEFWQRIDPATGAIAHELVEAAWDTRLLGDLYQDLSESARKRYALLQTPRFVEAFILDRTLTPAIAAFGYRDVTVLDPTCGSGHFLLGAFDRLLAEYQRHEPAANERERVQRVLSQVSGVDLNPFATAIARFRLLAAALRACGIQRLADAPGFDVQVGTGDSLLHGQRFSDTGRAMNVSLLATEVGRHHFFSEDDRADRILSRQHHVVVGNPPYITVQDRALNALYRDRYGSCHRQYSLVVPFMERFFELATGEPSGFIGFIVANSFMKREFGSKLIEQYLPKVDLTHVVDTSGAYIPGHGTPTVILFGRNRPPTGPTRAVMGIRGEPTTPAEPSAGRVWSAILEQVDVAGSESAFVSVRDLEQRQLHAHPWSLGGGGAAQLKAKLDAVRGGRRLGSTVDAIGFYQDTHADEAFVHDTSFIWRHGLEEFFRLHIRGEGIRDWSSEAAGGILFPFDGQLGLRDDVGRGSAWGWLWCLRTLLWSRRTFQGSTYRAEGRCWYDYHQFPKARARRPLSIAFAFIATHNHFVFDRAGTVFNRSAPVIKLLPDATEVDHLAILGLSNSSTACFWMKQAFHNKGATSDSGVLQADPERFRFEFDATKLADLPLPDDVDGRSEALLALARALDEGGRTLADQDWAALLKPTAAEPNARPAFDRAIQERLALRGMMVRWQEELDWLCYELYGLMSTSSEARSLAWTLAPADMPPLMDDERPYRATAKPRTLAAATLHDARLRTIAENPEIRLIERPDFKRRWFRSAGAYDAHNLDDTAIVQRALGDWLLRRLESAHYWTSDAVTTTAMLSDSAGADADFLRVGELFRGRPDFDVAELVRELVESEGVPYLPVFRYKESGLRKRQQWEETWARQRAEDAIDARVALPESDPNRLTRDVAERLRRDQVGDIPVPPKYVAADYRNGDYWRLRGKLDVPKERFILYPGAERASDPTPVIGWAGWNHLRRARALADYYVRMQEQEAWSAERLTPLLAGLLELVPWLKQWHNDVDPEFGVRMGDYYADFVAQQAHGLGVTVEALRAWAPVPASKGRKAAKKQASSASCDEAGPE